jgi:hypothetical protein
MARLPAGRVEVQVRTLAQSAWANTYERLGDVYGRGIRYGEEPAHPRARDVVEYMQATSEIIAEAERVEQESVDVRADLDAMPAQYRSEDYLELIGRLDDLDEQLQELKGSFIERLRTLKTWLDAIGDNG